MKRLLSCLLALAVLARLPGVLAQGNAPLSEDFPVPQGASLTSAALHQGRMLMGGSNIYEVVPGTGEMTLLLSLSDGALAEKYPHMRSLVMANDGNALYGLDPRLKPLLERAANLRTQDISPNVDWSQTGAGPGSMYTKPPLMAGRYHLELPTLSSLLSGVAHTYAISYGNGGVVHHVGMPAPMPLALDVDSPARLPVTLTVMAVNPRGKHVESATRYVENYVQQLAPDARAMLYPALNAPIPNPDAASINQWLDAYEAEMQKQIAQGTGAERTELEERYRREVGENEKARENARWLVRAEALQMYRGLMEHAFVQGYDDITEALQAPDIQQPLKRFMAGKMSLEQFLQEAEGKLRLMRQERGS